MFTVGLGLVGLILLELINLQFAAILILGIA